MWKLKALRLLSKLGFTDRVPVVGSDADAAPIDAVPQFEANDSTMWRGHCLALALCRLPAFAATEFAARWATSGDDARRRAIAEALSWPFRLVGDDVVIDHLSRDPDPTIRTTAARAAWLRRTSGGDDGVLDRLADDPCADVRRAARLAVSR